MTCAIPLHKGRQVLSGSSKIATEAPSVSGEKIENLRTINQLINLNVDYLLSANWNVANDLPVVLRDHTHMLDSAAGIPVQQAKFNELGDVRVLGKFRFGSEHHAGSGIMLGLKLPTGAINKTMTPPDLADPATPYALERSSQPGSGSTGMLLGAYYHRDINDSPWGGFASSQIQDAHRPVTTIARATCRIWT
ncbi:MAG: hypothetical protein WA632_13200 [Gallionella sp.]